MYMVYASDRRSIKQKSKNQNVMFQHSTPTREFAHALQTHEGPLKIVQDLGDVTDSPAGILSFPVVSRLKYETFARYSQEKVAKVEKTGGRSRSVHLQIPERIFSTVDKAVGIPGLKMESLPI